MVLPFLYIAESPGRGRGVYTREAISAGTLIESSPVIVMSARERELLDQTLLHDYIFEWEGDNGACCMALGWLAVYNHAYKANCEYEMNYDDDTMAIRTVRDIAEGEELFTNYNGDWNDEKPVWFDVSQA